MGRTSRKKTLTTEDLCGKCKTDIQDGELVISCNICMSWFHGKCTSLENHQIEVISKLADVHWFCEGCQAAAANIFQQMTALKKDQEKINTELANINNKLTTMKEEIVKLIEEKLKINTDTTMKEEIVQLIEEKLTINNAKENATQPRTWATLHNNTPDLKEIINEELNEQKQREEIKLNLVVTGIEEGKDEEEDLKKIKTIIEKELKVPAEILKVERVGRKRTTENGEKIHRLLKIHMKDEISRKSILRKAIKLRESSDEHCKNNIFISPDQTRKQQIEAKNLRDLLKQRRREEPDKILKIRKGEIVEETPK